MPTLITEEHLPVSTDNHLPGVEPVTPAVRLDPFDDPDWVFEPKYDGIRAFVYAASGKARIRSRQDLRLEGLDDLCERLAGVLQQREVILDGEIVSLDREGKPNFRDLIRGEGFLAFAAFDLLWLDGQDLRGLALEERKRKLGGLLPEDTGPLYKILTLDEYGRALFGAIRKMDLAGIVAKRRDEPYGAGTTWLQIANPVYSQGDARMHLLRRRERSRARR